MSFTDLTAGHSGIAPASNAAWLRGFVLRLLRRRKLADDRSHLHEMPDYLLRDIGLTRDQIDDAVARPFADRGPFGRLPSIVVTRA